MTVKELIEKLQAFPQNTKVVIDDADTGYPLDLIEVLEGSESVRVSAGMFPYHTK